MSCVTIHKIQIFWKVPSLLINLVVQTGFSQQLEVWFHQSKSQLGTLLLWRRIRFKNCWLLSLNKNLDSPKITEYCYLKRFISIIEISSCVTIDRFDFLHGGHNQQSYTLRRESDSNFSQLVFLHQNPDNPKKEIFVFLTEADIHNFP